MVQNRPCVSNSISSWCSKYERLSCSKVPQVLRRKPFGVRLEGKRPPSDLTLNRCGGSHDHWRGLPQRDKSLYNSTIQEYLALRPMFTKAQQIVAYSTATDLDQHHKRAEI